MTRRGTNSEEWITFKVDGQTLLAGCGVEWSVGWECSVGSILRVGQEGTFSETCLRSTSSNDSLQQVNPSLLVLAVISLSVHEINIALAEKDTALCLLANTDDEWRSRAVDHGHSITCIGPGRSSPFLPDSVINKQRLIQADTMAFKKRLAFPLRDRSSNSQNVISSLSLAGFELPRHIELQRVKG